jgi:N-acetylglutamate synthase-like GNAT family acetyltransferase
MFAIRAARRDDLPGIQALLRACELPAEDLSAAHLAHCIVISQAPRVIGCIGIEPLGIEGLLHSLSVDPMMRNNGFADSLLQAAEAHARAIGLARLYLLTASAGPFFLRHGYEPVAWESAPPVLRDTTLLVQMRLPNAACHVKSLLQ